MDKVKLALNYALMLEMLKAKGYRSMDIVTLLEEKNEVLLESIGEGIPSWKTLVDYYHENKDKFHQALECNYEIGFLTKGALKSLLSIKFGLKEGKDFEDTGEFLRELNIAEDDLQELRTVIAKNWTIIPRDRNIGNNIQIVDIELTHKLHF